MNLNREKPDDRDSYVNKRINLPGELMGQLFKQYYRSMLNGITKFYNLFYQEHFASFFKRIGFLLIFTIDPIMAQVAFT